MPWWANCSWSTASAVNKFSEQFTSVDCSFLSKKSTIHRRGGGRRRLFLSRALIDKEAEVWYNEISTPNAVLERSYTVKASIRFWALTCLAVLTLATVTFASCVGPPPDRETESDSMTDTPTDTPTETPTEAPTDGATEAPTEEITEAETLPDVEPSELLIIKDIRYIGEATCDEDWNDMVRLYTSLQGRLNKAARKTGRFVYQMYDPTDEFWLDYISGEGKMLNHCAVTELSTWDELWAALGDDIKAAGLVVWDPNAPATANVAATVCSVDGYLPVRYDTDADSLYTWLTSNGVEVKLDLVGKFTGKKGTKIPDTDLDSSGSVKCDPYLWALELYMDKCSSTMLAYALDGASQVAANSVYQKAEQTTPAYNQLYSHDYYIYNECFFIDLTCVSTETPCDDPNQPRACDSKTLAKILETMQKRNEGQFTKLMGFPPWYMKYTTHLGNGKTEPVALEWQFVAFITEYNFIKEADAAHPAWMTNASVYCQYDTSATEFVNNDVTVTETYEENVRYFSIYIGDYDSSAWLKNMVPGNFTDPNRGQVPLMWAFNPNLSDRVPMIFDYVYENKTSLDYFTTGDTGAGYVFPSRLKDLDMWVEYNKKYLSKFDMDIVGFIIDDRALSLDILKAYGQITAEGAFTNQGTFASDYLTVLDRQTVFLRMWDIYPNNEKTHLEEMYQQFERYGTYNFAAFRTIVQSTTSIVNCAKEFEAYANAKGDGYTYKYVDTYTLFDLIRQSGQGAQVSSK